MNMKGGHHMQSPIKNQEGEKNHTGTSIAERRVKHKDIKAKCTKQGKKIKSQAPKAIEPQERNQ
ncbi:hypothetical protein PDE_02263 [Penicillium oxalicum 114-2]|uniref:Uncharacterized protein n=1 Tax=Penicillium oxalicum (strain 114-2 / CGMCC 5302) TaxID=933388 RepID=S7Z9Q9_PENO1|nr:hypothetical protein PDE_02263 [Penicillium oxalicum 114-2]